MQFHRNFIWRQYIASSYNVKFARWLDARFSSSLTYWDCIKVHRNNRFIIFLRNNRYLFVMKQYICSVLVVHALIVISSYCMMHIIATHNCLQLDFIHPNLHVYTGKHVLVTCICLTLFCSTGCFRSLFIPYFRTENWKICVVDVYREGSLLVDPELQEGGQIMEAWERRPHWGLGAKPLVRGSEERPHQAHDVFLFQRLTSF